MTAPRRLLSSSPVRAFVGLGGNLGDVHATLESAVRALAKLPNTELRRRSSWYRSAPVDACGPDFLNAVIELETTLGPHDLWAQLQAIEAQHGRERSHRNAPRTLDLDLLLHGDACIATPALTVPHPRLHERAFVLAPLAELWPQCAVPGKGTVAELLERVAHQRIERLAQPLS
jgi:2-amino-4-hydroxy-6-hydroxymethyldihydropteridine diphosphokinase